MDGNTDVLVSLSVNCADIQDIILLPIYGGLKDDSWLKIIKQI